MSAFLGPDWGQWLVNGSAVTLLAGVVMAILRGLLVPRATLDVLREDLGKRVDTAEATAEQWRQVAMINSRQVDALLIVARVTEQTMRALPSVSESTDGAGP